jgi:hypothetical protein
MCSILSGSLPASKSYAVRGWHFVAGPGTLTLTQGRNTKDIATYRLVEFRNALGRAFRLAKIAGGTDAEADNYDVLIDPAGHDSCECRGFLRHGHCKHVSAVRSLLAEGAFDACPACAGNGWVPTADLSAVECPVCSPAAAVPVIGIPITANPALAVAA